MRLLIVTNLYPPYYLGGYEVLCENAVAELRRRGHDVFVLTSVHGIGAPERGESLVRSLQTTVPWDRPAQGRNRWATLQTTKHNYRETRAVLEQMEPDLVFFWSQGRITLGPAYAAQDAGYRTAFTMNDYHWNQFVVALPGSRGLKRLARVGENRLMPQLFLDGIDLTNTTCISKKLRADLVNEGVQVANAEVLYQGIPIEQFPMREQPGEMHQPVRFLYVGQLHEYKGPHTAVAAFADLSARKGTPMTLTLVGAGPDEYTRRLHAMVDELGIGQSVSFTGRLPVDSLPTLYREHDIFLFTSIWPEPFGLTFLEAMASGIPVISTTVGGQSECLDDGENCLTFTAGDASSLAGNMERLMYDAALRRAIAITARRRVEDEFTMQAYIDRIEGFLARLVSA